MKTLIKKIIAGVMVLCLVSTLNCQTTYAKEYNNEEIIIGEYDGPLQDFSVQTNNSRSISNVRIYSYATYDRSTGIKIHIKLYVPAWESPQPEFTAMSGIVSTTMHNRTEQKGYYATALGEKTISTDVSTGVYGASGEKGTINVSGVATSNNALGNGGGYSISYAITIP